MKIIKDHDPEGVPLENIAYGELFSFDGAYYMRVKFAPKLEEQLDIDPSTYFEYAFAVNLETGEIGVVKFRKVPPISSRIRISGRAD